MAGLMDSATAILSSVERRLEVTAQNVANAATTGYKRQISFTDALGFAEGSGVSAGRTRHVADFGQGRLVESGSRLDLAIFGPGLFRLRDGDAFVYTRGGSFTLGEGGLLIDPAGRALQMDGGGDVEVHDPEFSVLPDGTLLEHGIPTGRIGLFEASDMAALSAIGGSLFAADHAGMEAAGASEIRQGFVEKSNVVMSDEMIAMTASLRQAEGGGRLIQFYDQLIGQAITTFSRNGK